MSVIIDIPKHSLGNTGEADWSCSLGNKQLSVAFLFWFVSNFHNFSEFGALSDNGSGREAELKALESDTVREEEAKDKK